MDSESQKRRRFGEPLKFLPVIFVSCTIFLLWFIYVFYHCAPLLQIGANRFTVDQDARFRGIAEITVFHCFTGLLVFCYICSILVSPGEIPNEDAWQYPPLDGRSQQSAPPLNLQETKRTGDRRSCKWCGKYKPDRCHHCRVCKKCILKMDHHCPWIYNCVGFLNYKYFFLLLLYSALDCMLIFFSMFESVELILDDDTPFMDMFLVVFGETLSFFLGVLISLFFCFHIWLMLKAMSTIEFCEKSAPKKDSEKSAESSAYNRGWIGNIKAVLGDNPLLWLLPFGRPAGDGLIFVSSETRLTTDMEYNPHMRQRTRQKAQPAQQRRGGMGSGRLEGPGTAGSLGGMSSYDGGYPSTYGTSFARGHAGSGAPVNR